MRALSTITLILVAVGAINWGLIGLMDFNLVALLLGTDSMLSNLVYILVGLSGLYSLSFFRLFLSDSPGHKNEREIREAHHSA